MDPRLLSLHCLHPALGSVVIPHETGATLFVFRGIRQGDERQYLHGSRDNEPGS